jgi:dTDP-4-amino-4,6-dideoxygalactose transaminase
MTGRDRTAVQGAEIPFLSLHEHHRRLEPELTQTIQDVVAEGSFILGPRVAAFEAAFATYCGVRHAVGVNSGSDALTLVLEALGLGQGDEVITVANTYAATVASIVHARCTPVLVDARPDTYTMDPDQAERKITRRTKAILPVHLYGQPAHMTALLDLARRHGLHVIEDAAQAHGAQHAATKVGAMGAAACFSFYPSKNLGALGDGGAIVTSDDGLAARLRGLRNHGEARKYEHEVIGYNTRLDALQAAVLSVKLKHLDRWNQERRDHARLYDRLLADVPGVVTPRTRAEVQHVYHLYVIRLPHHNRDVVREALAARGIGTGIHYPTPVHLTNAFAALGSGRGSFPVAEQAAATVLSLPMYPELRTEQIERVCREVANLVRV